MLCKLCGQENDLKDSHIIPEFIYTTLYDEKHRFHVISTNKAKKNTLLQKGVREFLLCTNCETLLSKNERYVNLVFSGKIPVKSSKEGKLIHIEGLDYSKFKLFALSILWKAGVSSLPMFEQVQLGPHEKIIRKMVASNDAGQRHEYPFILSPVFHEEELQSSMIIQPTWTRLDGHYAYRFVFGGLAWIFLVSNHRAPPVLLNASISEEGVLTMIESDVSDMRFIVDMAVELKNTGKL